MFDRMLQTRLAGGPRGYSSLSVSIAVAGHVAVVIALATSSYLIVEQVRDPASPLIFERPLSIVFDASVTPSSRPPGGAKTPARRGGGTPRLEQPRQVAPAALPERPAPDLDPALDPVDEPRLDGTGPGGGEGLGDPSGVPWGTGDLGGPGDGAAPGSGSGTGPLIVNGEIDPPVLVHKVQPLYPEAARRARLQGRVILRAVIGTGGDVEGVEVLSASEPLFKEAAVVAVKEWKYRPARHHGIPVAVYFTVTVSFVLH